MRACVCGSDGRFGALSCASGRRRSLSAERRDAGREKKPGRNIHASQKRIEFINSSLWSYLSVKCALYDRVTGYLLLLSHIRNTFVRRSHTHSAIASASNSSLLTLVFGAPLAVQRDTCALFSVLCASIIYYVAISAMEAKVLREH